MKKSTQNKYKDNGLSGLINLGNTCFINSLIQVISHTYELNEILDKIVDEENKIITTNLKNENKQEEIKFIVEWNNLRKLIWSRNCTIKPARFIKSVQNLAVHKNMPLFSSNEQNDIPEFFLFIITSMHNALSRSIKVKITGKIKNKEDEIAYKCYQRLTSIYEKEYSEIWNLFYAINITILKKEKEDEIIKVCPESFSIISLSIPLDKEENDIYDCFNYFIQEEIIQDYYNENTNQKETIRKNTMFWNLPEIIVIDLKRYVFDVDTCENKKDSRFVDYPLYNLDLSKYVIGYNREKYVYDLYGIINHHGSLNYGHYTCFIKNVDCWFHFDDETITRVNDEKNIITERAYCFFYRRRK